MQLNMLHDCPSRAKDMHKLQPHNHKLEDFAAQLLNTKEWEQPCWAVLKILKTKQTKALTPTLEQSQVF